MCSLIASFNPDRFNYLRKLNSYRGSLSHSLAVFDGDEDYALLSINRGGAEPFILEPSLGEIEFYVGHAQAPTSQASRIHPAEHQDTYLWHNGIIKEHITRNSWDTELICKAIYGLEWENLNLFDGSFACIYYADDKLYTFRNEIAPLFYNDNLDFSSTIDEGMKELPPNIVYEIDLKDKKLVKVGAFVTAENPYDF